MSDNVSSSGDYQVETRHVKNLHDPQLQAYKHKDVKGQSFLVAESKSKEINFQNSKNIPDIH